MLRNPLPIVLLTTFALALAGCGGNDGDGDPTTTPDPTPTGTGTPMTPAPTTTPGMPPGPAAPIYINGTVNGVTDCTNTGVVPPTADTQNVPMEAWNRTYTLELVGQTASSPVSSQLCLVWSTGDSGNSGMVPSGATTVTVAADFIYEGIYSIKIE